MMTGTSADLVGAIVAVGAFAVHRPNRTPSSRVAWVAVIMCLPVIGVVAYLLRGETSIGHERGRRLHEAERRLAAPSRRAPSRPTRPPRPSLTCAARSTASAQERLPALSTAEVWLDMTPCAAAIRAGGMTTSPA